MQLEQRLAQAESRERLVRRVTITAMILATGLFPVVASGVLGGADPWDKDATVLSVGLAVAYIAACVVSALGIAAYYSRFSPRVRHTREKLAEESIRELRREVSELRRLVEKRQNPPN